MFWLGAKLAFQEELKERLKRKSILAIKAMKINNLSGIYSIKCMHTYKHTFNSHFPEAYFYLIPFTHVEDRDCDMTAQLNLWLHISC